MLIGQYVAIRNCYNAGDIEIDTIENNETVRKGSLVAYYEGGTLIDNCHCFIFEKLSWFGQFKGSSDEKSDVKTYETKESMKGIAKQLGKNYKDDTNEINEGYPILTWQ